MQVDDGDELTRVRHAVESALPGLTPTFEGVAGSDLFGGADLACVRYETARRDTQLLLWVEDDSTVWVEVRHRGTTFRDEVPTNGDFGALSGVSAGVALGHFRERRLLWLGPVRGLRVSHHSVDWYLPADG